MVIKVIFQGILSDWTGGVSQAEIPLPDGTTLADLLLEIRRLYGPRMPPQLRKKDMPAFLGAFWCLRGPEKINVLGTPLMDGDEIQLLLPLAGG